MVWVSLHTMRANVNYTHAGLAAMPLRVPRLVLKWDGMTVMRGAFSTPPGERRDSLEGRISLLRKSYHVDGPSIQEEKTCEFSIPGVTRWGRK